MASLRILSICLAIDGAFALALGSAARPAVQSRITFLRCGAADDVTDADVSAAARRVQKAAARFGKKQGKMATEWIDQALQGGSVSSEALVGKSEMLFGECLIDDEDGGKKCQELDAAMKVLSSRIVERGPKTTKKLGFSLNFAPSKVDQATDQLVKAAAKFGPQQVKAAKQWAADASGKGTADEADLLQQEIFLFGECLLSEDGSPTKCQELESAIVALQEVMGTPEPEPVAKVTGVVAPTGAAFGQAIAPATRPNGCYPYK